MINTPVTSQVCLKPCFLATGIDLRLDLTDLTDTESASGNTETEDPLDSGLPTPGEPSDTVNILPQDIVDVDGLHWNNKSPGLAEAICEELDKL